MMSDKGKLVGLGEIGLDYHVDEPTREEQIFCFIGQLKLANKLSLPISNEYQSPPIDPNAL